MPYSMHYQSRSLIMHTIKRYYKNLIEEYLSFFPCVVILGPRQCGKTVLLNNLGEEWNIFDLEKGSDYQIVANDPDLFLRLNPHKTAIDEAQLLPALFSALRVAIDQQRDTTGRFILTGSSSPDLLSSISESLAGRVGIIEMSPLLQAEINLSSDSVLYRAFLDPDRFLVSVQSSQPSADIQQIHKYWFQGGYPEPWVRDNSRFQDLWMEQYIQTYLERDISLLFPSMNRQRFRQFINMLAGLSGSVINYSDVARTLGVSQPTIRDYFNIVHGTFVWRHIPAYATSAKKRLVKHAKGYLRDCGLLHHLLRLKDLNQLLSHPAMGVSWEAMVIEEIIRGLSWRGIAADYYYYRTSGGAEVDLILEGKFGLIPIEIKYGQKVSLKQLRGIRDFMKEQQCPFGIVINNDERIRMYEETLIGIPFANCL